jgi:hypothetical protein
LIQIKNDGMPSSLGFSINQFDQDESSGWSPILLMFLNPYRQSSLALIQIKNDELIGG